MSISNAVFINGLGVPLTKENILLYASTKCIYIILRRSQKKKKTYFEYKNKQGASNKIQINNNDMNKSYEHVIKIYILTKCKYM